MILETKLTLPQPKAGALLRTALIDRIKNNLDKKLILITAGAGYGKTTLLVQLANEARLPSVFYDLDKSDSDLTVFYSHLVRAIKQLDPVLVKYPEELTKSATADGDVRNNIELLFGTLLNELHDKRKEELFIILDNYQNITGDCLVNQALEFFIDHLPGKIHVIISSRSVPPFPAIAKWLAKQDLYELSRNDLAFTGGEIGALLKDVYKTAFSEDDVRQLAAHTEGWITGIHLILRTAGADKATVAAILQRQADASMPLYEYFAGEILSGETREMQDFLTKCSILDVLTPGACEAVAETGNAGQLLKQLEKRLLFISVSGPGEYRCHNLFREFLQDCLQGAAVALHKKAGEFFKAQGNEEQAIGHYLQARDYDQAAQIICRIDDDLVTTTGISRVENWMKLLPEEAFVKLPELHIVACALFRIQGRYDEALAQCAIALPQLKSRGRASAAGRMLVQQAHVWDLKGEAEKALAATRQALSFVRAHKMPKKSARQLEGTILCNMAIVLADRASYDKAIACLLRARDITRYAECPYEWYIIESNLALVYTYKHDERKAFDVYRDLLVRMKGMYFYRIGCIYHNAVIFALHRGDVDWAGQVAKQGWDLCQPYSDAWSKAHLHYCFGIVNLQKGGWEAARVRLSEAAAMASGLGLASLEFAALRDIIRSYRYQGDYVAVREKIDGMLQSIGEKESRPLANLRIEQSLLESAMGNHIQALRLASKCLRSARRSGWNLIAFLSQMAMALIYSEQNKEKQAVSFLRLAVRYARLNNCGGLLARSCKPACV